jgi:hypothetical protein
MLAWYQVLYSAASRSLGAAHDSVFGQPLGIPKGSQRHQPTTWLFETHMHMLELPPTYSQPSTNLVLSTLLHVPQA